MAKEFSKMFYNSMRWKKVREYIFKRDEGLCQDCLTCGKISVGQEVHHKRFLTQNNINDSDIALGEDNLILLCKECHKRRHRNKKITSEGLGFNSDGELIQIQ